jgi:hypothetical protein
MRERDRAVPASLGRAFLLLPERAPDHELARDEVDVLPLEGEQLTTLALRLADPTMRENVGRETPILAAASSRYSASRSARRSASSSPRAISTTGRPASGPARSRRAVGPFGVTERLGPAGTRAGRAGASGKAFSSPWHRRR